MCVKGKLAVSLDQINLSMQAIIIREFTGLLMELKYLELVSSF